MERERVQRKKPSTLELWIFSGPTHIVLGLVKEHPNIYIEFITKTYSSMVNMSYQVKSSGP